MKLYQDDFLQDFDPIPIMMLDLFKSFPPFLLQSNCFISLQFIGIDTLAYLDY